MERTELFLLFPTYIGDNSQPNYINRIDIMLDEELLCYIIEIDKVSKFFIHEKYDGYYDAENVKAFLTPINTLEDCYPKKKTLLRSVLNNFGENWRRNKKQDINDHYFYYSTPIQDDTLCEITKRKNLNDGWAFLLINHNAFKCKHKFVTTKCDGIEVEVPVSDIVIKNVANWFEYNRKPKREYNWNPKHGEYGAGAHPSNKGDKVSVLMCSNGDANLMLQKAVGIDTKNLFYYDDNFSRYIEFKKEGDNTYHAFHLEPEDESRVPEEVKDKISQLIK